MAYGSSPVCAAIRRRARLSRVAADATADPDARDDLSPTLISAVLPCRVLRGWAWSLLNVFWLTPIAIAE